MSYQSVVLADSPAFLWPLNETSGTTAADATGNGRTGTYTSGYTLNSAAGPVSGGGGAVLLNGSTGHVTSSYDPTGLSAVSVECWVNLNSLSVSGNPRLVANSHTDSDDEGFQLMFTSGRQAQFWVGSGSANGNAAGGTVPATGWTHLVGTYDGTNVKNYVNGSLQTTDAFTGNVANGAAATLGIGYNPAYSGDYLHGLIAWVAVYPSALTATQVSNHYSAATSTTHSGTATLSGAGTLTATGALAGAATLAGSGTLAWSGSRVYKATVLNGSGTLTGTRIGTIQEVVTLSGTGTLTGAQGVTRLRSATLSGTGSLTVPGVKLGFPATLTGTGTLSIVGTGGTVQAAAGATTPQAYPGTSQVSVAPPGTTSWQYLGTLGTVTALTYSFACPGGADQLTCTVQLPATYRTQMQNPGWQVRVTRGGHVVWTGRMDEPAAQAGAGWTFTAVGDGNRGTDFRAVYSGTWPAGLPDAAVNGAIARGLPWQNPGIGTPSGMWLGQAQDSGSMTVTDLLNLVCTRGGLTWYASSQPGGLIGTDLSVFPLPTTVNRLLIVTQPVPRTLGGDINTLYLRYEIDDGVASGTSATFGTTSVQNAASVAAHGVIEDNVDLSSAGVMSAGAAQAVGNNVLAVYQRASFAGPFQAHYGELLNAGGAPIDPGTDQAGTVVRLILTDFGYGGEVSMAPITFIVGGYSWDDFTQVATITPYQALDQSLSGLLSMQTTVLTPITVA